MAEFEDQLFNALAARLHRVRELAGIQILAAFDPELLEFEALALSVKPRAKLHAGNPFYTSDVDLVVAVKQSEKVSRERLSTLHRAAFEVLDDERLLDGAVTGARIDAVQFREGESGEVMNDESGRFLIIVIPVRVFATIE